MPGIQIPFVNRMLAEAILRIGTRGFDAVLFGEETLQRTNRDRRIDGSAPAGILARCGADAAAD